MLTRADFLNLISTKLENLHVNKIKQFEQKLKYASHLQPYIKWVVTHITKEVSYTSSSW